MIKLNLLPFDLPESLLSVKDSFNELALDEDLKKQGNFCRSRGFSRFKFCFVDGKMNIFPLPHQPFRQAKKYNPLFPDEERNFPPLKVDPSEHIAFVADKLQLDNKIDWETGIHQIRITASKDFDGNPVPEGFHQDGFSFVAILVINREGVVGGKTSITSVKKGEFIFQTTLPAGTGVGFDDVSLKHYTSDIKAIGEKGYRDVLVLTFIEWESRTFKGDFEPIYDKNLALNA